MGLARLFYGGASVRLWPMPVTAGANAGNWMIRPLDHIEVKLAILPATMQTAAGRRLGEERLQWLRQFQADFCGRVGCRSNSLNALSDRRYQMLKKSRGKISIFS